MSDDSIELDTDESPDAPPEKKKDVAGTLMTIMLFVAFGCLTAVLTLQFLEYRYMRGVEKPEDPYAAEVLLPPRK